jgi:V-type H+-transporting ATPase subunit a
VEREIKKEEIPILNIDENVEAPPARELIEMESSFDNIENDLKEVIASGDALRKTFLELTEMRHVLHKTQQFFDQVLHKDMSALTRVIAHLITE